MSDPPLRAPKNVFNALRVQAHLMLVRRLMPWRRNTGKRLTRAPKIFVRDSGIAHALLGLGSKEDVLGHPVVGPTWEGFVVENIINCAPADTQASYYRASGGAEIDLILTLPGRQPWAIDIKRSLAPKLSRGFHSACADVNPEEKFVVYPGSEGFTVANDVRAINIAELVTKITTAGAAHRP